MSDAVAALIDQVLGEVARRFYRGRKREFCRDRQALMRAIARYGHACLQRGWQLDAGYIHDDLVELLSRLTEQDRPDCYLPIYLEGAVDRRIRTRAEEISAESRISANQARRALAGLTPVEVVREPTTVEVLATVYRDLRARRRKQAKQSAQLEFPATRRRP